MHDSQIITIQSLNLKNPILKGSFNMQEVCHKRDAKMDFETIIKVTHNKFKRIICVNLELMANVDFPAKEW